MTLPVKDGLLEVVAFFSIPSRHAVSFDGFVMGEWSERTAVLSSPWTHVLTIAYAR
jgi:hypothetical protein